MDAHGVHVLDEADADHLVLGVADDLDLELLPAEDRLLDQDLRDRRGLQAAVRDGAHLVVGVHEPAARAAHRVGGADDHRVADLGGEGEGVLDRADGLGARHVDADLGHGALERLAVLAALDDVLGDADHLHVVGVEDAGTVERGGEVEARLAAQIGQQRVGLALLDDRLERGHVERLDVGLVGHHRVGHDRGRVAVDQGHLVAEVPQRLARLGAGVVELTRLPDDDGAGANDEDLVDVFALGHPYSIRAAGDRRPP